MAARASLCPRLCGHRDQLGHLAKVLGGRRQNLTHERDLPRRLSEAKRRFAVLKRVGPKAHIRPRSLRPLEHEEIRSAARVMHLHDLEHFGVSPNSMSMEIVIVFRLLRAVGGNIDIAIIVICGVAWALAGCPYTS
jgi:hypothetical protein